MHKQYHHMKPCWYLYLATQMTKGMVKWQWRYCSVWDSTIH